MSPPPCREPGAVGSAHCGIALARRGGASLSHRATRKMRMRMTGCCWAGRADRGNLKLLRSERCGTGARHTAEALSGRVLLPLVPCHPGSLMTERPKPAGQQCTN